MAFNQLRISRLITKFWRVLLIRGKSSAVDLDPVGSASFLGRSGLVSIYTNVKLDYTFSRSFRYTVPVLSKISKIMIPMTMTRNIKQCKLTLLWIKKKNSDSLTCVNLEQDSDPDPYRHQQVLVHNTAKKECPSTNEDFCFHPVVPGDDN